MAAWPWPATEMPRWRASLIRDLEDAVAAGQDPPEQQIRAAQWLRAAELYFVSGDMTAVALDASTDLPPWIPAAVLPEPIGLVVWAGDLPPLLGGKVVRGLLWVTFGGQLHLHPLSVNGGKVKMATMSPIPVAREIRPSAAGNAARMIFLAGATWITMQQPTVSTPRPVRGGIDSSRLMRQLPRMVTIIDLRPMRHVTIDRDPDHPGRIYTHRWLVRGHWRNQPYGPGRSEVRRIWIPSYTKGPANAPLLAREHVNVWRR